MTSTNIVGIFVGTSLACGWPYQQADKIPYQQIANYVSLFVLMRTSMPTQGILKMLTDTAIKNTKPTDRQVRKSDSNGLFMQFNTNGSKLWRLAYRFGGKQKLLAVGRYPDVSLKQARERRDEARRLLDKGIDPGEHRKITKTMAVSRTEDSFEAVSREWFTKNLAKWGESYADDTIRRLERDVFPWMGGRPIMEITAPELLVVLRRIEERGTIETAHRVRSICSRVFRYGIAIGRVDRDPAADLRGALSPVVPSHRASITDPEEIGALLRAIDAYKGTFVVRCALQLAPMLFVRPGELRQAEWSEFDLDGGEWCIPGVKMKMKQTHIVPLARQAVAILRELQPLTGNGRYVFPNVQTFAKPMSAGTVLSALRRMGYANEEMCGHGFRSTASTLLNEQGYNRDWIERQLAHSERDGVRAAYNYAQHLPERRKMMQAWADYLDQLAGRNVLPLKVVAV
ncbi:MAG: integrase arm-type DNA-binding domain-containing protein [Magnetococcus sp. MYC-9]